MPSFTVSLFHGRMSAFAFHFSLLPAIYPEPGWFLVPLNAILGWAPFPRILCFCLFSSRTQLSHVSFSQTNSCYCPCDWKRKEGQERGRKGRRREGRDKGRKKPSCGGLTLLFTFIYILIVAINVRIQSPATGNKQHDLGHYRLGLTEDAMAGWPHRLDGREFG